jgi:hypothetical protein
MKQECKPLDHDVRILYGDKTKHIMPLLIIVRLSDRLHVLRRSQVKLFWLECDDDDDGGGGGDNDDENNSLLLILNYSTSPIPNPAKGRKT